jgi:hypothetical protein
MSKAAGSPETLSPADASIVRRDSALPGLATLIDPDAFAAALRSACPDADIVDVRLTKIRYSPNKSCRADYKVEVGGEELSVYAKTQKRAPRMNWRGYPTPLRHKIRLE